MENETTETNQKERVNVWKVATILLGCLCVILFGQGIYQDNQQNNLTMEYLENYDGISQNEILICQSIQGTPSWVSNDGKVLGSGYKEFPSVIQDNIGQNYSINPVTEYLIKERIHFYYATGCGWCDKQIEWFGEDNWNAYQESNLTHDCRAVLR